MKSHPEGSVEEPARSTPVYGSCDVLVIGGGPAGTAAAVAAGRLGADTVLVSDTTTWAGCRPEASCRGSTG